MAWAGEAETRPQEYRRALGSESKAAVSWRRGFAATNDRVGMNVFRPAAAIE
jgi:hypothetical protein